MIADLKPYPAMKNSGLEWSVRVPEHWEVRTIKTLFREKDQRSRDGQGVLLSFTRTRGIIPHADVSSRMSSASDLSQYRVCMPGDLVMNRMQAWSGMLSVSSIGGLVSPDYSVFVPTNPSDTCAAFFEYLFRTPRLIDQFARRSKGIGSGFNRLYTPDFGTIRVTVPPICEQIAIVHYLDYVDRRIRRYIHAKRKLIALLEEKKQVIIHQAVRGQIDVRTGKPYPAYKDSGVEWLGKVPEHWGVVPLSRALTQRKEKNDPIKATNILSLSLDTGVIPYAEKKAGGNKAKDDISAYMLAYPGDIVVNSMNVVVGSVGLSKYFGAVSPVYYMLRPRQEEDLVEYFDAIFQDVVFQRSLFGLGNGIMFIESRSSGKLNTIRLRIPMTRLKKVVLPYPAPSRQAAIVQYLNEATADIDTGIERARRQTELLNEYRTRLVTDVVTGKLDVCEAAAALPEADTLAEECVDDTIDASADSNLQEPDAMKEVTL